jgi:hypothetical protein
MEKEHTSQFQSDPSRSSLAKHAFTRRFSFSFVNQDSKLFSAETLSFFPPESYHRYMNERVCYVWNPNSNMEPSRQANGCRRVATINHYHRSWLYLTVQTELQHHPPTRELAEGSQELGKQCSSSSMKSAPTSLL